ncbi:hypothetical protein KSS87_006310 [Heliosperma pusillum]|nr:hypothetical protein KSS87_006310 [Heliosperma pusillum]
MLTHHSDSSIFSVQSLHQPLSCHHRLPPICNWLVYIQVVHPQKTSKFWDFTCQPHVNCIDYRLIDLMGDGFLSLCLTTDSYPYIPCMLFLLDFDVLSQIL